MSRHNNVSKEVLEKAQEGNQEALREVFDSYRNFVFLKAKNYFLVGAEKEDLVQEGMIGLLKAVRAYDASNAASFKTFATICIKRQLITAIKSANTQKNMALNQSIGIYGEDSGEDREISYNKGLKSYISYNPEEQYLTKEQILGLKGYLAKNLSSFEQEVFSDMVSGHSYKEIAEKLGKSLKSVDNAIQRIKRKSSGWLDGYQNL